MCCGADVNESGDSRSAIIMYEKGRGKGEERERLKTVIRGAKIIFSVTLRVIMGRVGFIAHIRVIGMWRIHFHRFYGPQYLGKCCKLVWRGSF